MLTVRDAWFPDRTLNSKVSTNESIRSRFGSHQKQRHSLLSSRLTSPAPLLCGDFQQIIPEYSTKSSDEGVTIRSCMPLPVLADLCLMTTFSHHHVRSTVGHELLVCLQHSCQPFATLSTVATTARLQQAARAVPVAADPYEVHQRVFNLLRAMREGFGYDEKIVKKWTTTCL